MLTFIFSERALKEWKKLDTGVQNSLENKLHELKNPELFDAHIKPVVELLPATHRIRIGYYRFLIKKDGETVTILGLGHRRDIYR